jgi:hypothetical protein
MSSGVATPGNGLLLFLRVGDFDTALQRTRALVPRFEQHPDLNPNTGTREFSLRDPDRYCVTIRARSDRQQTAARRRPGRRARVRR